MMTMLTVFLGLLSAWQTSAAMPPPTGRPQIHSFALRIDSPIPHQEQHVRPYLTLAPSWSCLPGASALAIDFTNHLNTPDKRFYAPDRPDMALAYADGNGDKYWAFLHGPDAGFSASPENPNGIYFITDPPPRFNTVPIESFKADHWEYIGDLRLRNGPGGTSANLDLEIGLERDPAGKWYACGPNGINRAQPADFEGNVSQQMGIFWAGAEEEKTFAGKLKKMGIICYPVRIQIEF